MIELRKCPKIVDPNRLINDLYETIDSKNNKIKELQNELDEMRTYSHETVKALVYHRDQRIKELEAQNAVLLEALEKIRIEVFHLCQQADHKRRNPLGLPEGSCVRVAYEHAQKALSLTPSYAKDMVRKKNEPDWFFCDIDPDESGDSAYEAMYQHRPRLEPTLVRSSFIGPDFWCVMCPKEPDDEDGEEVCMSFATEDEAKTFCVEMKAKIEAASADGITEEK